MTRSAAAEVGCEEELSDWGQRPEEEEAAENLRTLGILGRVEAQHVDGEAQRPALMCHQL